MLAAEKTEVLAMNNGLDVERVRAEFPALHQEIHGKPLVYLDSGASAQKPRAVLDALNYYYEHNHANVHRGVHLLSQRATDDYEGAREKVRAHINAASQKEIIYVRGTTEGVNLVAQSYARPLLKAGDEMIVSEMEHHSNIVPWQMLAEQTAAKVVKLPILDNGELDMDAYDSLLNKKTKIVAVTHVSNALGTINPIKEIIAKAHAAGAKTMVDGAQATPHMRVDVQDMGCDFYAFSAHKIYGPTGVGVLYGKQELLESMEPYQGGGDMIKQVSFDKTVFADLPYKFEAGTPAIAQAIGMGAAIDYMNELGLENIETHEHEILEYATAKVDEIEGMRIIGTSENKAAILSFELEGIHPHDIGTILDNEGIAVRTGHHCAMPVMLRYDVPATARASLGLYNNREDIDRLFDGIRKVQKLFAG